jgi:hypothetical protein
MLLATNVAGWDPANPGSATPESPNQQQVDGSQPDKASRKPGGAPRIIRVPTEEAPAAGQPPKKKGIFSRILDIFK